MHPHPLGWLLSAGICRILHRVKRSMHMIVLLAGTALAADPLVDQVVAQLPPGLQPVVLLCQADPVGLRSSGEGVASSVVTVTGQPFAAARQVRVPAGLAPAWKATLHVGPIAQPVARGHLVLAAFWEGDHWLPNGASWRKDWTPKPAGVALTELLGTQWRTNIELSTAVDGRASCRAFRGELNATATAGGRSADAVVVLDHAAEATIRLPR